MYSLGIAEDSWFSEVLRLGRKSASVLQVFINAHSRSANLYLISAKRGPGKIY